MTHRRALLGLVVVAAVWGCSFTIIKEALDYASPLVLLALRFLTAALIVAPAFRGMRREELRAGVIIGLLFWGGFVFQTSGLAFTTPSRSAFITGLSVPLTPVVVLLVYRRPTGVWTALSVLLAALGMYFLTSPDSGAGLNRGDLLTLGCAVSFAGQIVAAGHFARTMPALRLLAVELALTGVLSLAAAPLVETPRLALQPALLGYIVFLSLSAVATFWFQLRAQRVVSPAQTALVFSLEPVFAALTSYVVLGERLGAVQWLGGALILGAMLLPELESARRRTPRPI